MLFIFTACSSAPNPEVDGKGGESTKENDKTLSENEKNTEAENSSSPNDDNANENNSKENEVIEDEYNTTHIYNRPPENLPDDWESMKFDLYGDIIDAMGKNLKIFDSRLTRTVAGDIETLPAGQMVNVGLSVNNSRKDFVLYLRVLNPTQSEIPVDEATIVRVGADRVYLSDVEAKASNGVMRPFQRGFILPKGIAPFERPERVKEVYGEPSEEGPIPFGGSYYLYKSADGNKKLSIIELVAGIDSFMIEQDFEKEFTKELKAKKGIEDASKFDKEAFVNINGHKIKMYSPFMKTFSELKLVPLDNYNDGKSDIEKETLKPKTESSYFAKVPGFDKYIIKLRIANLTKKDIRIKDSTIVGVGVKVDEYLKTEPIDYKSVPSPLEQFYDFASLDEIVAIAPYGIRIGEDKKKAFAKIPDNATEKVFAKDGGAYASNDAGNMHMKIFVSPNNKETIDEIMLTVNKIIK